MACLLLGLLGCTSGGNDAAPDADEHVPPLEAPTDTVFEQPFPLGAGQVAEAGLPALTVHEDVTLESVGIGTASGTAELIGARLSYEPVKAGCWNNGEGMGPLETVQAEGAVIRKGERPYLVLYVRPKTSAVVDQVIVRYAHEGEHTELRWNAVKLDLTLGTPARCKGER